MGTISLTLVDDDGTARASLTGINWWVFNGTSPSSTLTDEGTAETTDGSGVLTITTSDATEDVVFLVLSDSDGTVADCNSFAAPVGITYETTPDAFTFTDQTGADPSSIVTSDAITVSGIDTPVTISVTDGEYDINSSGSFTSSNGTVNNGDTVRARHTSSSSYETAVDTVVTIGGVSDTFTSTTRAADYPTISSATVDSAGTTLTVVFNQACSQGASYSDSHLNLDASTTGDNVGLTYASGDGTTTWTFTAASTILSGETVNLDFDGTANSIEAADNGDDLQTVTNQAVTNNSTQIAGAVDAPTYHSQVGYGETTQVGNTYTISSVTVPTLTNGCLVLLSAYEEGNGREISSVTFNGGESFTRGKLQLVAEVTSKEFRPNCEVWYLVNPTATTADLVVTMNMATGTDGAFACAAFENVDQSSPVGNTGGYSGGSGDHPYCDVTISSYSTITYVAAVNEENNGPFTQDVDCTEIFDDGVGENYGVALCGGYRSESVAGTYSVGATSSTTSDAITIAAIELKGV